MNIPPLRFTCFFLTVSLLRPAVLPGQRVQLEVGERVRVAAPPFTDGRLVGTVLSADSQALVLATRHSPQLTPTVEIPREAIESLEISLGQRSNTLNGLAYGALGGAVLGAGTFAIVCLVDGGCSADGATTGGWIAFGAVVGAGGGAVLGLLVGSLVKTEAWEDASARGALYRSTPP